LKVRSLKGSYSVVRGLITFSLAGALACGAAATPLAASAEATPPPATSVGSAETSASMATTGSVAATLTSAPAIMTPPVAPGVKRPARKLTARQIIAKTGRERGLSKAEISALMWICRRESNFHPTSESRNGLYHGLFQLNRGMAGGHPWKDPAWNTKRAIKYMRGRYGGVMRAKAFWVAHHWY
jgi:Transglycosylase SLT domain